MALLWVEHLNAPLDEMPTDFRDLMSKIKSIWCNLEWFEVYDFIGFMAPWGDTIKTNSTAAFIQWCNKAFEEECAAYRFVHGIIAPITNEVEVEQVEKAMLSPYDAVSDQIKSALSLLGQKPKPDLRNCIKESINAVETAARVASDDAKGTLGKLLPVLEKKLNLHPSLQKSVLVYQ